MNKTKAQTSLEACWRQLTLHIISSAQRASLEFCNLNSDMCSSDLTILLCHYFPKYSETSILCSLNLCFPWICVSSLWGFPQLYICFLKSHQKKLPWFYAYFHLWIFQLTSAMIGPAKLANKTCAASIAKMNSTNKTSVGNSKPSQAIPFLFELL